MGEFFGPPIVIKCPRPIRPFGPLFSPRGGLGGCRGGGEGGGDRKSPPASFRAPRISHPAWGVRKGAGTGILWGHGDPLPLPPPIFEIHRQGKHLHFLAYGKDVLEAAAGSDLTGLAFDWRNSRLYAADFAKHVVHTVAGWTKSQAWHAKSDL